MSFDWVPDATYSAGGYWMSADMTLSAIGSVRAQDGLTRQQASNSSLVDLMTSGPLASLDTALAQYVYGQQGGSAAARGAVEVPGVPGSTGLSGLSPSDLVTIDLVAKDGNGAALLASLQSLGLQNGASFGSVASGRLALGKVAALTTLPDLAQASLSEFRASVAGSQGTVVTQADKAQHDDVARTTYGVDGSGIKVGLISDSFNTSGNVDTQTVDIASSDLPVDTTVLQDYSGGTDEGRGMAQLVHDLAPNSAIAFATGDYGMAGFANNILALQRAGAKVIADDLLYFDEPSFEDGIIAQAVDQVTAQGVSYFSSAGNEGFKGYESAFNVGTTASTFTYGGQTYTANQFADGQTLLPITLGSFAAIVLQWDQPYASANTNGIGSSNDLDLFFCNSSGQVLSQSGRALVSTNNNIGRDPRERITISGASGYQGFLKVGLKSGAAPTDFRIIDEDDSSVASLGTTATNINTGTVYGHAAAAGANAVGAASYADTPYYNHGTPQLEAFSSGGPTRIWYDTQGNRLASVDTRQTPAFTAVDGGNTTFFYPGEDPDGDGHPNFFGTSAAAPDAAGTAALMLQARSTLTPADIRHLLMDSAIDMDDPSTPGTDVGYDTGTGSGLIQADLAVGYASTLLFGVDATHRTLVGSHLNDTFQVTTPGPYTLAGAGGADTVAGTAALLTGGAIADFGADDQIHVTDATLAGLTYGYDASTGILTFREGTNASSTMQLATGLGAFGSQADRNGGVDLGVGLAVPALVVSITGVGGASNVVGHTVTGTVDTAARPQAVGATVTVSDAGTALGTTTVGSDGRWSLDTVYGAPGASHTYHLVATATDAAGDTGTSGVFDDALDFTPNRPLFGSTTSDSDSHQGQVYALYDGLLSRTPDPSGWEYYVPKVDAGFSLHDVAQSMLTSSEYTQTNGAIDGTDDPTFVNDLYASALGRVADPVGADYWQQRLSAGASRADVAVGFAVSAENERQLAPSFSAGVFAPVKAEADLARLYYGVFDRAPDGSGQAYWEASGSSTTDIAQAFLTSPEYTGAHPTPLDTGTYVESLYQNTLGRTGTGDPGSSYWVSGIDSGQFTRAQATAGFATSEESLKHLAGQVETGFHLS